MASPSFDGYAKRVKETDSTRGMIGKMAKLMINRGYGLKAAYKHGVHKKDALSYDTACELMVPFLKEKYGSQTDFTNKQRVNLAKAYVNTGQAERAKEIGNVFVLASDFGRANKVFKYGKFKPEDIAGEIDDFKLRNEYLSHTVGEVKKRREKYLERKKKKVFRSYRDGLKPVFRQKLDAEKKLKKDEKQFMNLEKKRKSYLELSKTAFNDPDFEKKMKEYQRLEKQVGDEKKYEAKLDKLRESIRKTEYEYSNLENKIALVKVGYKNEKNGLKKRSRERLQKDAENMGYNVDLFPEYADIKGKGKSLSKNDKKNLKSQFYKYLQKGKIYNAIEISEKMGKRGTANKLRKYLENTGGDEREASRKYLKRKNRRKNALIAGAIMLPVIGAGIGSFVPHKVSKYNLKEVVKTYTWKDIGKKEMIYTVKEGDRLLDITEKFNPGLTQQGLARRNNRIARANGLFDDSIWVTGDGKIMHEKGVDKILGDLDLKPGMKIKVGEKLVPVTKRETRKYKVHERAEERGKWPNKKGALFGGLIGAGLSLLGLGGYRGLRRRRKSTG